MDIVDTIALHHLPEACIINAVVRDDESDKDDEDDDTSFLYHLPDVLVMREQVFLLGLLFGLGLLQALPCDR